MATRGDDGPDPTGNRSVLQPRRRACHQRRSLGPVHVWNLTTGEEKELAGHDDVSYPQFSPDGAQIVSASDDGTVRLWDVATGRSHAVPTLEGLKYAAAIDASGRRMAIRGATPLVMQASDGGSARLRLDGHRGYVKALVFSPDSGQLLTGSDDGTARIWNARTGALERILRGHEGIVRSVSYSDDGKLLATAGGDGTVRVWPTDGGDEVILVRSRGPGEHGAVRRRGDRFVSAGNDGTIRVWDTAGGDALVVLHQHEGGASGADFGGDGLSVVSAGDSHKLSAAERERLLPSG